MQAQFDGLASVVRRAKAAFAPKNTGRGEIEAASVARRAGCNSGASVVARGLLCALVAIGAMGGCWSPTLVTGPEPDEVDASLGGNSVEDAGESDAARARPSAPPPTEGELDAATTSTGAARSFGDGGA